MLRSATKLARVRAVARSIEANVSHSGERHGARTLEAGLPRTIAALIVLPSVGVATGMHYNPEFRAMVEERAPGATDALAKFTGVTYLPASAEANAVAEEKSTLPKNYDKIPDILKRIKTERTDPSTGSAGGTDNAPGKDAADPAKDLVESAKEKIASGAAEAKANAAKLSEKLEETWQAASESLKSAETSAADSVNDIADKAKSAEASAAKTANDFSERIKDEAIAVAKRLEETRGGPREWDDAKEAKSTGADAMKSAAESAASSMTSAVKKVKNEAVAVVTRLEETRGGSRETDDAKEARSTGADAMKSAAESAASSVTSAAKKVKDEAAAVVTRLEEMRGGPREVDTSDQTDSSGNHALESAVRSAATKAKSAVKSATSSHPEHVENGGDKFARLFGRGGFDPSATKTNDVLDPSVYRKPAFMEARENSQPKASLFPASGNETTSSVPEVQALEAELKSQAKWDAVRLQEAVRAQSVADKKLAAAELSTVMKNHELELSRVKEQAIVDAQQLIERKTRELELLMEKRRDSEVAELLKQREEDLKVSIEADFLERERAAADARQQELADMRASVEALHEHFEKSREHRKASQHASSIAASAFSLKDALQGNGPFKKELSLASKASELGKLVADSIPSGAAERGVPTVEDLKASFATVSLEGRKAALVPEDDVGTIWGHFLATIVSHLKVAVDYGGKFGEPRTDEDRIRRAEKCLLSGDVRKAVESLQGLSGLAAEITKDWMADANARIAADLGAQALLADAIVTQQSVASMSVKS